MKNLFHFYFIAFASALQILQGRPVGSTIGHAIRTVFAGKNPSVATLNKQRAYHDIKAVNAKTPQSREKHELKATQIQHQIIKKEPQKYSVEQRTVPVRSDSGKVTGFKSKTTWSRMPEPKGEPNYKNALRHITH